MVSLPTLEQGGGVSARGVALSAQHARDFRQAFRSFDPTHDRERAAARDFLLDHEVRPRRRRDLRQVRDAEHLSPLRDLAHLLAHRAGRLAADVGIHFIEDEDGHLVFRGQDGLHCQHHPRHFAR